MNTVCLLFLIVVFQVFWLFFLCRNPGGKRIVQYLLPKHFRPYFCRHQSSFSLNWLFSLIYFAFIISSVFILKWAVVTFSGFWFKNVQVGKVLIIIDFVGVPCGGVRSAPPMRVLDMTLNKLMLTLQKCWYFGECSVPLSCHHSQVHSGPEWLYLIGPYLWVK